MPVFVHAPEGQSPWVPGGASRWWLHQSLKELDAALRARGSRLEDYIAPGNPVRFLDAFVAKQDLSWLGFTKARCAATGRPPYDPAMLLKLYLYGYLHRVRSSRLLEVECQRNVEVIWLTGKQNPDFKTIADFRKDNLQALRALSRQFTLLCRKLDLFGGELLAIDGSKFVAVNAPATVSLSKTELAAKIAVLQE